MNDFNDLPFDEQMSFITIGLVVAGAISFLVIFTYIVVENAIKVGYITPSLSALGIMYIVAAVFIAIKKLDL